MALYRNWREVGTRQKIAWRRRRDPRRRVLLLAGALRLRADRACVSFGAPHIRNLKGKTRRYDVDALWDWFQRIVSTLGEHLILFPKENRALLVNMHVGAAGDVMVIEAQADEAFAVSSEFQPPESKPLRPHRDD